MMAMIKGFLNWLLRLPIFAPLFGYIGWEIIHVTPNAVINYAVNGFEIYWAKVLPILLLIIAAIILIRLFGLLNPGNFGITNIEKTKNSPLSGKKIIFLGSSVTKGFASRGRSFVDMIAERTGASCVKEAVSGTTLADNGEKSYVARLKKMDKAQPCDLFVCQLSTNDATKNVPLGKVSDSKDMGSFDTKTVCGAIEYIIAYAKETWNCPIAFYTSPEYASPAYKAMVDVLKEIAAKWNIDIIDLWNDREINAKENKKHSFMNDQIHPTQKGYKLWAPIVESALSGILSGKGIPARPTGTPATVAELAKKQSNHKIGRGVKIAATVLATCIVLVAVCGAKQGFDILLINSPGNAPEYAPEVQPVKTNSPLKGKTILCVGSSVVQGASARNNSFVEYLGAIDQANMIKESVSGATIAYQDEKSYAPRMMTHTEPVDAVIIQLSTNDAGQGTEMGVISDSFNMSDFDKNTTMGSFEIMMAYAKETWNCPVIIFTVPYTHNERIAENYGPLVDLSEQLAEKWGAEVLNLWDNEEFNNVSEEQWKFWMANGSHPQRAGYLEWWTPEFQKCLYKYFE